MNSPYSFIKLYKLSFKKNPIFDIKNSESYFSLICSTIITFIVCLILLDSNNSISIVSAAKNVLLNISIGLLGMLGFIISGLAIISGTIGNKVANQMDVEGKFDSLIKILFSFYYIGAIIGALLLLFLVTYFLLELSLPLNIYLFLILTLFLSYGFFFSVFYAVSLLGTSINMFIINYNYSKTISSKSLNNEMREYFIDLRIDALTQILHSRLGVTKEQYLEILKALIKNDCPTIYQDKLSEYIDEYYGSIKNDSK